MTHEFPCDSCDTTGSCFTCDLTPAAVKLEKVRAWVEKNRYTPTTWRSEELGPWCLECDGDWDKHAEGCWVGQLLAIINAEEEVDAAL